MLYLLLKWEKYRSIHLFPLLLDSILSHGYMSPVCSYMLIDSLLRMMDRDISYNVLEVRKNHHRILHTKIHIVFYLKNFDTFFFHDV